MAGFTRYRVNRVRKEEEQKAEFSRKLSEMRMQGLRAQMNPHFIFNSLNAIEGCIEQNKNKDARVYLSKFSKLVRIILENFSKDKVSLSREIESLKLYLEMEALRFSSDFHYELQVDPVLETELIQIPTMLIQPYIENAIWHGLAHSDGAKNLIVCLSETGNLLQVTIQDNGIGREAAMKLKESTIGPRESVAMKNTAERLKLHNVNAKIEICDMKDADGKATGTLVTILIPLT
jgi:LytS/YehU family sensor histidine kinase